MNNNSINAISPIDGRYYSQTHFLDEFFSEKALIKYRLRVEVEYFIKLTESKINQLSDWNKNNNSKLRDIYINFDDSDAIKVKEIEKTTNHDVKAVEYFLKEKFELLDLEKYSEFIHFGLTSQDINNTAIPLSLKEYFNSYYDLLGNLIENLKNKSNEYKDIAMLARTHAVSYTHLTLPTT